MPKSKKPSADPLHRKVQGVQIGYFELCQEIGGQLVERGRGIAKKGIYAPAFYEKIMGELRFLRGFCARAEAAMERAQADWDAACKAREIARLAKLGLESQ